MIFKINVNKTPQCTASVLNYQDYEVTTSKTKQKSHHIVSNDDPNTQTHRIGYIRNSYKYGTPPTTLTFELDARGAAPVIWAGEEQQQQQKKLLMMACLFWG